MLKKLIKIPYYLLVTVVLIMGVLLIATLVPIPGNFKVKIVKSGSMEPTIRTGGVVVVRPEESYQKGDIITFGKDTKTQIPTTHRIIGKEGEGSSAIFTTKGDANDAPDPAEIRFSDIRGKVVFSLPYLGFILDFTKKPMGFLLIVGIPALLVIIDEIGKIKRELRRMRDAKKAAKAGSQILDLRNAQKPKERAIKDSVFYMRTVAALIIISASIVGISSIGGTASYYSQSEASLNNALKASDSFSPIVPERQGREEPLAIPENSPIMGQVGEDIISAESDLNQNIMSDEPIKDGEVDEVVEAPEVAPEEEETEAPAAAPEEGEVSSE